jgi:hypothetical protein
MEERKYTNELVFQYENFLIQYPYLNEKKIGIVMNKSTAWFITTENAIGREIKEFNMFMGCKVYFSDQVLFGEFKFLIDEL